MSSATFASRCSDDRLHFGSRQIAKALGRNSHVRPPAGPCCCCATISAGWLSPKRCSSVAICRRKRGDLRFVVDAAFEVDLGFVAGVDRTGLALILGQRGFGAFEVALQARLFALQELEHLGRRRPACFQCAGADTNWPAHSRSPPRAPGRSFSSEIWITPVCLPCSSTLMPDWNAAMASRSLARSTLNRVPGRATSFVTLIDTPLPLRQRPDAAFQQHAAVVRRGQRIAVVAKRGQDHASRLPAPARLRPNRRRSLHRPTHTSQPEPRLRRLARRRETRGDAAEHRQGHRAHGEVELALRDHRRDHAPALDDLDLGVGRQARRTMA